MVLEMFAAEIFKVETFRTKDETEAFFKQLEEARIEHWGVHPWKPNPADDFEAFKRHLVAMASTFSESRSVEEARYDGRNPQPMDME
jgi:hypothetical protein